MHTVELLDQAITAAKQAGIFIRQDWFGGAAAGPCEFKGRRWVFIDLALSPQEQLDQVLGALHTLASPTELVVSPKLQAAITKRASRVTRAA